MYAIQKIFKKKLLLTIPAEEATFVSGDCIVCIL